MIKQLIDALGGIKVVADALDTSNGAVANWRLRNSVPWRHRHALASLAAKHAVQLPENFWSDHKQAA